MRFLPSLLSVLLIGVGPASAQDPLDVCEVTADDWVVLSEDFNGTWSANNLEGFSRIGPMAMPISPGPSQSATIEAVGNGSLRVSQPGYAESFIFEPVDHDERWLFADEAADDKLPGPLLNDEDLELFAGCPNEDIPRLIAQRTISTPDGDFDFTYRLMVVDSDALYGLLYGVSETPAGNIEAWRSISLTR